MIDVIIPVYNSSETIINTLLSLANQDIIDKLNIYIIDDASNCNYSDIINMFSFLNINYFRLDTNVGSGMAREYGINNSSGEFLFFLDSDDLLPNPNSISLLYNGSNDFDFICGKVFNEKNGVLSYTIGDLHGKLYRRQFLIDNNIHFNDTRIHEDNAFNSLVLLHKPRENSILDMVYFYSYNSGSITYSYDDKNYITYIDNMKYVVDIGEKHNCDKDLIVDYLNKKYKYLSIVFNNLSDFDKDILKDKLKVFDKYKKFIF